MSTAEKLALGLMVLTFLAIFAWVVIVWKHPERFHPEEPQRGWFDGKTNDEKDAEVERRQRKFWGDDVEDPWTSG